MSPREELERLLAGGRVGELASMIALGAALAVKRGRAAGKVDVVDDGLLTARHEGQPLPAEAQKALKDIHTQALEEFRTATLAELDVAIAFYTAHLRAAGYSVEAGYDH